jgi:hypothetical protein
MIAEFIPARLRVVAASRIPPSEADFRRSRTLNDVPIALAER